MNISIGRAVGKFKEFLCYQRMLGYEAKKTLCMSMVLSQFAYADVVFMNMTKCLQYKIQKIQNWCVRFIFNIKRRDRVSVTELRKKLGWLSMSETRILHGLTYIFKMINDLAPHYLSDLITFKHEVYGEGVSTRSSSKKSLWISNEVRTKSRNNAFVFSMSNLYNDLPEEITTAKNVSSFKNRLKNYIKSGKLPLPHNFL